MNKRVPESIRPILMEVKDALVKIYGDRLKGIILYGYYARGDADEGSDIDIIIILEEMEDFIKELERCSENIHEIDLEYDTLISIIPMDTYQYYKLKTPLILNIKKEGITL